MSVNTNADLGRRFFLAQDRLKGGPDPDLCTPDYTIEIAGFPAMPRDGHQQFAESFYAAFPDLHHTVDDVFADNDRVAVHFTLRGTHEGDFLGIQPTGRVIEVAAIALLTTRDGRVARIRSVFDQMGMMRQLGVVPSQ